MIISERLHISKLNAPRLRQIDQLIRTQYQEMTMQQLGYPLVCTKEIKREILGEYIVSFIEVG